MDARLLLAAVLWAARASCQDCDDSFDVHQDKIIRTQDSRAMGAKYINERDVPSREDCLRLCCQTSECDVFVFEEKVLGSCYLFQCGTPDDFKCKFTKHRNYTSGVLVLNRHLTELESQIKHTQHEHELAKLSRQPESEAVSTLVPESTTTAAPGNKEVAPVIPTNPQFVPSRRCSRYQFECHGTGECIAIYNACDGIPQCSDGSDEAPELGCPSQVVSTPPSIVKASPSDRQPPPPEPQTSKSHQNYRPNSLNVPLSEDMPTLPVHSKASQNSQWVPQMLENQRSRNSMNSYLMPAEQQGPLMNQPSAQQQQLPAEFPHSPAQLINQVKQYGREGEGLLPSEMLQWPPSYQQEQLVNYRQPNSGGSQIFSHKGNGLVAQSDSLAGQFDPMQQEYSHYNYYENIPFHKSPQSSSSWQPLHKQRVGADLSSMPGMEESMNMLNNLPQTNVPGQDYYYEENFRTRLQPQLIAQRLSPQANLPHPPQIVQAKPLNKGEAEVDTQEAIVEADEKSKSTNTSEKKPAPPTVPANHTTEKPKEVHHRSEHHQNSHRKVEALSAELSLSETSLDPDSEGQNVNPRGAILSLTMGLSVTGIMLVLVGCRMRMVRRRMRRGSKSSYAHDADFLVNGMYL